MKALLMHPDRDFDAHRTPPWNEGALVQDLALETLLHAMAGADRLVYEISKKALLVGCDNDASTILYRQAILQDAIRNPAALRDLYSLTLAGIEAKRKRGFGLWSRSPSSVLFGALEAMDVFVGALRSLLDLARAQSGRFESQGFKNLFATLERELTDDYLARIQTHLRDLKFRDGALVSAELGPGGSSRGQVLRHPYKDERPWIERLFGERRPAYTYRLPDRDEVGARALSDLRDRGIHLVANALAQSADHVDSFFQRLRDELAFYVGCVNLHERLAALGEPTSFPRPLPASGPGLRGRGLYDPCLALQMQQSVMSNAVDTGDKRLVVVTGANQGGKSSFLRAVGVAQLMMQTGLFVAAESLEAPLCAGLVTHYKREEDATMKHGKLDEELARMSEIVDHLRPNAILLCNESFAATNEREGSEIARQVVTALTERGIRIVFVTHLHAFARDMFQRTPEQALFLRAERLPDGTRTFRLVDGEPRPTSYGRDLYERIFA